MLPVEDALGNSIIFRDKFSGLEGRAVETNQSIHYTLERFLLTIGKEIHRCTGGITKSIVYGASPLASVINVSLSDIKHHSISLIVGGDVSYGSIMDPSHIWQGMAC